MFDSSSLFGKASELFGGVDTPDPAESLDADQLMQQVEIDPTNLSDLSAVSTDQLLSQYGTDGGGPDGTLHDRLPNLQAGQQPVTAV